MGIDMIGNVAANASTTTQAGQPDDGYDIELSTRTMAELRAHVPDVEEAVFRGLENLHLLDRTVGTEAWQHYHRFHATATALVAVRLSDDGSAPERREAIPYDELTGDGRALLARRPLRHQPNGREEPHRLLPQFERAMAAYSALTAFERECEAATGASLPDSGTTVN